MKARKARAKTKTARPKPRRAAAAKPASTQARKPAAKRPAPAAGTSRRPLIERERRRLPDLERDERLLSSVRTGREELKERLTEHTEASPTLTAGDIDARWEEAYAVGDEAPGGDNPTPDQDRVDDIGKALGIQYRPDEELQGGDEIVERDRNRWELDPASSDDWPHEGTTKTKRPPED